MLEPREDVRVELRIVELVGGERDEIAPLIAPLEHVRDQRLAVRKIAVAVQKKIAEGCVKDGVGLLGAEQQEGAARGFAVEGTAVLLGIKAAAGTGEDRKGAGDLGADRVDGADLQAIGLVEEGPFQLAVALEHGAGEFAGLAIEVAVGFRIRAGGFEVAEDTVTHLGGGLDGKGDGEDLFRAGDGFVTKQLEEALDEEASLAGAGGSFHDEGAADIEGLQAGGMVRRAGWLRRGCFPRLGEGLRGKVEQRGLLDGDDLSQARPPGWVRAYRPRGPKRRRSLRSRRPRAC